jgi:hypothetical protein
MADGYGGAKTTEDQAKRRGSENRNGPVQDFNFVFSVLNGKTAVLSRAAIFLQIFPGAAVCREKRRYTG